jgi:hypothetical protein
MRWLAAVALLCAMACSPSPTAQAPRTSSTAQTQTDSPTAPPADSAIDSPSPSPSPAPTPIPTPTPTASPSPAAAPPTYAVLVDLFAGGSFYNVALVGADGRVVARAHAAKRSLVPDAIELPYVNSSRSRVYYLDGDRTVRYLKADGTTGFAATIQGSARVHAAFAVSPDDSRIAVALLDYSVNPVALTLYVENLGGAQHAVIFTSNNHYIWPVAWHLGQLVVAYLGPNAVPFKGKTILYSHGDLIHYPYGQSPYGGINFHVINPVTAFREAIISGGGASGLLTKAGTAVVQGDADDWNGNWINWNSPHDYGSFSAAASISPDGTMIAACCPVPATSGQLVIWYPGDQTRVLPVTVTSIDWVGWLDNSHLVTGFYQTSDGSPSVVNLGTDAVTPIDAHGIVAAIFPSDLEP